MLKGISCSLLQRIAVMDGHLSPKTNIMPVSHRQNYGFQNWLFLLLLFVCLYF